VCANGAIECTGMVAVWVVMVNDRATMIMRQWKQEKRQSS